MPSSEPRNLSVVRRSARSRRGRSWSSQYLKTSDRTLVWVSLRSRILPEEHRAERGDRRPDLRPELPREREELHGVAEGLELHPQLGDPLAHLRVGPVPRERHPGQVTLHVGDEGGDAGPCQLPGDPLERLGLPGPGRPGDEPVPVEHGQGDLHPDAGQGLDTLHRGAQVERRLGQRVAGFHRFAKRRSHDVGPPGPRVARRRPDLRQGVPRRRYGAGVVAVQLSSPKASV